MPPRLPSVYSCTRRVCCSKMADTQLEISPLPDSDESSDSSIFDPRKESKEPMKKPRDYSYLVIDADENPPMVDSDDEIPPMKKPINEVLKNIDNLIYIRKSEKLGVALEAWESWEQAFGKRVQRKKKVLRNTRNEVITLTGFFVALQGLLLTAAAVSSSSQCTNLGFLLAVSGLVTFCALAFVCHKQVTMRRLQSVIVLEKAEQKTFMSMLQQLRQEGEFFNFERTNDYIKRKANYDFKKSTKFALSLFGFSFTATAWVAIAIGIFGALCLVAIDRLLCHSS